MTEELLELVGADKVRGDLGAITDRLIDSRPIMRKQARVLELNETAVFEGLAGRYVDTGATKRSLTEPGGEHAIREATPHGLSFGSSIWYAHYLTEHIGPVTDKGGMKRHPPSAVLKLEPETAHVIAADVLGQIVGSSESRL